MKSAHAQFPKHYFQLKGQRAERIIYQLGVKTFLVDWCYLNPKLPNGKELCDLLVVFDDIAIIWQIKDLKLNKQGRYKPAEVHKNLRQLLGARRQLLDLKTMIELENPYRQKEAFNPNTIKEVHLISVMLGPGEDFFSFAENVKNHTVHIFTKAFAEIVLNELDTIADFTEYLRKKEELLKRDINVTILGGEEELLAFYLLNQRSFERFGQANHVLIQSGAWEHLREMPEYKAKKKEDEISYFWDSIVNRAHEGSQQYEYVARELARPNRFQRRFLSKAFLEAHIQANHSQANEYRRVLLHNGTTYCFLFQDKHMPRKFRKAMLVALCWAARGKLKNAKVLGVATERQVEASCSYDFCLLYLPVWTDEEQKTVERLQSETGMLMNPSIRYVHEAEYPESEAPNTAGS